MRKEILGKRLEQAAEKGQLTQEQAEKIKEWWSQRPKYLPPGFCQGLGLHGGLGWGMRHFPGDSPVPKGK